MNKSTVYNFINKNRDFLFPNSTYIEQDIEQQLIAAPNEIEYYLNGFNFKNPTTALILSVLFGTLGADRFYIGDYKMGIVKLVTYGGFGILWLIDLFKIKKLCCTKNCKILTEKVKPCASQNNADYGSNNMPIQTNNPAENTRTMSDEELFALLSETNVDSEDEHSSSADPTSIQEDDIFA